ncbi:MAG: type I glyceraldehyde-3-phosphate dehydrogenase [Alphaproteobacteria bacterium]|nr:type I glyceraldehyde-3-phosphate dehydrogenase [Alphaproteobacteria bacterium]
MTIRIGINGLGRIGRCVLRAIYETNQTDIELVAVNGPAPIETHIHLLKYDSVHGRFATSVEADGENLKIGGKTVKLLHERDPKNIPWGGMGVDLVLECTGKFNKRDQAAAHLESGAKRVLVSAPADGADSTIVYGVNNTALKAEHQVVSVGSCTTNGLAPLVKALHEAVGIEHGFMTTIHAYTGDQNLVDGSHKDMRRARAAAMSMIPSTTGAAKTIGLILPELKGRLDGTSIRVPTANVSMVDLTFTASRDTTKDEINAALSKAANGALKGVLDVCSEPLVSIDYNHSTASSNADLTGTFVTGNRLVRVASWYDNEWAFSCRMLDVARLWAGM